jgi:hypothetical protein
MELDFKFISILFFIPSSIMLCKGWWVNNFAFLLASNLCRFNSKLYFLTLIKYEMGKKWLLEQTHDKEVGLHQIECQKKKPRDLEFQDTYRNNCTYITTVPLWIMYRRQKRFLNASRISLQEMLCNCRDRPCAYVTNVMESNKNQKAYWMTENIFYPLLSRMSHKNIIVHYLIWRIKYPLEDFLRNYSARVLNWSSYKYYFKM